VGHLSLVCAGIEKETRKHRELLDEERHDKVQMSHISHKCPILVTNVLI